MKQRYCSNCGKHRDETSGIWKKVSSGRRWICKSCVDRSVKGSFLAPRVKK